MTTADMKKGLSGLATIGTTAPFIGLFGTVIGIINAFRGMAMTGSGGIAAVSAGIAEALVTTALGLFVAIPAVWIFNIFMNKIERFQVEMSNSASELIDYFIKRRGAGAQPLRARPSQEVRPWAWVAAAGRDKLQSDINVTPLVDVCLVLLIIFMVVTPMLQKGVRVQLPQADNPDKKPEIEQAEADHGRVRRPAELLHRRPKWLSEGGLPEGARRALPARPVGRARHQGRPAAEVRRRQGSHAR